MKSAYRLIEDWLSLPERDQKTNLLLMSSILISVIIPVFNTEKYLSRCVESVLNQSFKDFELILVDDGSTDNSGKICDEYSSEDSRVKVIHQDNQGVSVARNQGMAVARGLYVSFVDSDDWIEKDYLKTFVDNLHEDEKNKLPVLDVIHIDAEKEEVYYSGFNALTFSVAKLFDLQLIKQYNLQFPPKVKTSEDTLFMADYLNHVDDIKPIAYLGYHYETNDEGACQRHLFDPETYLVGLIKQLQMIQQSNLTHLSQEYLCYRTGICFHHFVNALYLFNHTKKERVSLLKQVLSSSPNALDYYPRHYKFDKIITSLYSKGFYLIGDFAAYSSWKYRNR